MHTIFMMMATCTQKGIQEPNPYAQYDSKTHPFPVLILTPQTYHRKTLRIFCARSSAQNPLIECAILVIDFGSYLWPYLYRSPTSARFVTWDLRRLRENGWGRSEYGCIYQTTWHVLLVFLFVRYVNDSLVRIKILLCTCDPQTKTCVGTQTQNTWSNSNIKTWPTRREIDGALLSHFDAANISFQIRQYSL